MVEKTAKERGLTLVGDHFGPQEAWVYLVWGLTTDGRCDLLCVAASEESREMYEGIGRKSRRPLYHMVTSELVLTDHAFGQSMLPQALALRRAAR